jgi:hypothetical protein
MTELTNESLNTIQIIIWSCSSGVIVVFSLILVYLAHRFRKQEILSEVI